MAVAILCNNESFDLQALTQLVLDAALGRPLPGLHPPTAVVAEAAADLRTFLKENPGNENAKIMLGILAREE